MVLLRGVRSGVAGMVLVAGSTLAHAQVCTWQAPVNDNWNDPTKWLGGVPDVPTEEAIINALPGGYNVDFTQSRGILRLSLNAGPFSQVWIRPGASMRVFDMNGVFNAGIIRIGEANVAGIATLLLTDPQTTINGAGQIILAGEGRINAFGSTGGLVVGANQTIVGQVASLRRRSRTTASSARMSLARNCGSRPRLRTVQFRTSTRCEP